MMKNVFTIFAIALATATAVNANYALGGAAVDQQASRSMVEEAAPVPTPVPMPMPAVDGVAVVKNKIQMTLAQLDHPAERTQALRALA